MWGRSVYAQQASFVRQYKLGRDCYNLSPVKAARFAVRIVEEEKEDPESVSSVLASLDFSQACNSQEAAHGMKKSEVLDCPPLPSRGSRKSMNWAPNFNHRDPSEKKPTIKRFTRLSSQAAASLKPENDSPLPEKMPKAKIHSTEDSSAAKKDVPIRIVTYVCNRGKRKQCLTPAALARAEKKERRSQSRAKSNLNLRNAARANVGEDPRHGKEGQLDEGQGRGKQARKGLWFAVPLDDMESEESPGKKCRRASPEAKESSKRFSDSEMVRSEVDQKVALNKISAVCAKLLQNKAAVEFDDKTLEELQVVVTGVQGVMSEVEHMVQSLQERKVQRRTKEKAEIEATAAAGQQKLRNEITKLKQKNQMVAAELAKEQDKTACHICFTAPRDAIVLPCMHFQYCNECLQKHQRRSSECPTCRGKINGVLRCNLCTS